MGGLGGWGELELDFTNPLVSLPLYGGRGSERTVLIKTKSVEPTWPYYTGHAMGASDAGGSLRARRWSSVWIVQRSQRVTDWAVL